MTPRTGGTRGTRGRTNAPAKRELTTTAQRRSGKIATATRFPVDDSLFFKLVRVVNLTARPFSESIGRANQMTLNEWRAMVVLANHPGAAASDVAVRTGLDKMSVSRVIAGLDRHKRLIKREDPLDKRRTQLWLSAAGQRVFERIGTAASIRESQLFASVSKGELAQMGDVLDRLIASLLSVDSEDGEPAQLGSEAE